MIEVILVLISVVIVCGLCLHHQAMKRRLRVTVEQDRDLVRKSAESSIMASNTVNPIIALTEVTKAVQIVEGLHGRYGPDVASEISGIDTRDLLMVVQNQKDRILQDVMEHNRSFLPPHPLNKHAKLTRDDGDSDSCEDDRPLAE